MVEGQRELHHRTHRQPTLNGPRPIDDATRGENGCLTGRQHRGTAIDVEDPDIGDGDRGTNQIGWCDAVVAGTLGEVSHRAHHAGGVESISIGDLRHHQSARSGYRDA